MHQMSWSHHLTARLAALATMTWFALIAVSQTADEPVRHWQGFVETSFHNTMDLSFEFGIKYFPIKFVGVGVGIGIGGDIGELQSTTFEVGDMQVIADNGLGVTWFGTGLQLQSPILWRNGDGDVKLSLKADAGIRLPFPKNDKISYYVVPKAAGTWESGPMQFERNHGGASCFLYFKPAVALDINRCQIWLGYLWSNMDPYSGVRNVTIMGHHLDFPRKRTMHGLSIGIGYRF